MMHGHVRVTIGISPSKLLISLHEACQSTGSAREDS